MKIFFDKNFGIHVIKHATLYGYEVTFLYCVFVSSVDDANNKIQKLRNCLLTSVAFAALVESEGNNHTSENTNLQARLKFIYSQKHIMTSVHGVMRVKELVEVC